MMFQGDGVRYTTLQEVKKSEAFSFYRSLGYTETQSVFLTLLDLSRRFGGFPHIVEAFSRKKKEDPRSFSEFFCDYVFDMKRLEKDGFIPEPAEIPLPNPGGTAERGGFFGRLFGRSGGKKGSVNSVGMTVEERGLPNPSMPGGPGQPLPPSVPMPNIAAPQASAMKTYETVQSAYSAPQASAMMSAAPAPGASMRTAAASPAADASWRVRQDTMEIPVIGSDIEQLRTDSYEIIEEKGFKDVSVSPTSTFRTTYNTAAASVLLSNIRRGSDTRHSMVRTEELLNYLSYDLASPQDRMFEVTKELGTIGGKTMLFLGIQGKKTLPSRQNICFLLDVSGSMSGRSEQMLMSMFSVLSRMNDGDIFSLVTYSSTDHVVVNGLKLRKDRDIEELLEVIAKNVYISGATYGSAGIEKAYEIIEKNKIKDGVNRVIILTDGDLNFGITDKDGLKGLIEKKKLGGAYFSAIGTGTFNLMDDRLEALAKNGNGNYFVVNEKSDIEKNIVDAYESLVFPIAKNVKAQVEFNPQKVQSYKLVGYENRALSHEDFRDDTVIAEPFGSGSYCIALYELKMQEDGPAESGLRYQKRVLSESDELATLSLRYEDIEGGGFHELSFPVESELPMTDNLKKAAECAALAEKLREENADDLSKNRLLKLLES